MKKLVFTGLIVLAIFCHYGCANERPPETGAPKVAATIFPLYDITKNIVGDKIEAVLILPPGASPHTYELTPKQAREMQGVKLVFGVGHGLDDWAKAVLDILPNARLVVVDKGVHLEEFSIGEEHGEEHGHAEDEHRHEGLNPHYWLSIANGKVIAGNIAEELSRLDPGNADYYKANLESYLAKLDGTRQSVKEKLAGLSERKLITFHGAWFYFAEEFDLEIVGAFEPFPGRQPTPRYLMELQKEAREHKVKAVFSEPQLSNETISAFVDDIGLKLYVLDPLGGVEGRDSYIGLFGYNADVLAKALSDE